MCYVYYIGTCYLYILYYYSFENAKVHSRIYNNSMRACENLGVLLVFASHLPIKYENEKKKQ